MAIDLPITDPLLAIGGANGLLLVGESFDKVYDTLGFDGTTCDEQPVDFTGFTMSADVLDASGAVLESFIVTPSIGDASGSYRLQLLPAQVTTSLRDNATTWRFQFSAGAVTNKSLLFNQFTVT